MKKTLQDQYLLIKEGKGHKGVFLTEAKRQFPNIVRNAATFDEAVASLQTKNIISENIISVIPAIMDRPKKEAYETAFENFLAEAKKKKEDDEKAELKKTSKQVEEDLDHIYDNSDEKNPDNMIFDQIMMGYYAEMKDPKNADKTMQELKDIVFKNLSKNQIYYTENAQFGIKDLGYSVDHPGLGEPKEAKGKYKASGYGDLNEGIFDKFKSKPLGDVEGAKKQALKVFRVWLKKNAGLPNPELMADDQVIDKIKAFAKRNPSNLVHQLWNQEKHLFEEKSLEETIGRNYPGEIEGEYQGKPMNMPGVDLYDFLKDMLNIANSEDDFVKKVVHGITDETSSISKENEFKLRNWYKKNSPDLNENKLRRVIREIISEELEEIMYQAPSVNTSNTGGGGRRYIPNEAFLSQEIIDKLNFSNPGENAPARAESLQIPHIKFLTKPEGSIMLISNFLYNALQGLERGRTSREKEMGKNELEKLISDMDPMVRALIKKNVDPKMSFGNYHAVNMPIEREKGIGVKIPLSKKEKEELEEMILRESLLKESVEKDLANINKEAEHEVLQNKLDKIDALIDHRRSKLEKLDEDEDMKALTDKNKVKELEKDIKKLEVARKKVEKIMSKFKGKKKEVIDETEDNPDVDTEYFDQSVEDLEQGKSVSSIDSENSNLASSQQEDLNNYLNSIAPDELKSDYVY